jgi:Type IIA topoisomerase (DNA gyrase/topo II, topoisomerase IV), A subunit
VIELIISSPTGAEARGGLFAKSWRAEDLRALLEEVGLDASRPDGLSVYFGFLSDAYPFTGDLAPAILEMRLPRLTSMGPDQLFEDYRYIVDAIRDLLEILGSSERLWSVVGEELLEV